MDTVTKYQSRKLVVTVLCIVLAAVAAVIDKLTGELALVLTTAMGTYNVANAWVHRKDDSR